MLLLVASAANQPVKMFCTVSQRNKLCSVAIYTRKTAAAAVSENRNYKLKASKEGR